MKSLKLFYWTADHSKTHTEVGFIVVAESMERAGWPILGLYNMDGYFPKTCEKIADVKHEPDVRVVGYFGPNELEPPKSKSPQS